MRLLRRLSVRWLLVFVMVGFTAIILLVQGVPLASYVRTVERDRIVTGLQRDAFTLAGASEEALQSATATDLAALNKAVVGYGKETGARVVVTNSQGTVVASSDGTDLQQDYTNRPEIQAALNGTTSSGVRESQTAGEPLLFVSAPVRSGSEVLGAVRITYPAAEVDAKVDDKVRMLAIVGLVTLLAAAGIAILLAGVVTGPLRRLRETSEAIADGELDARVDTDTIGELRDVAQSFNRMAERVESLVVLQRGFAGDASHQLRTPLTALRLRLETIQEFDQDDPVELARSLDAMRDDVDRMQRMVDGLLLLARADRDDQRLITVEPVAIVNARVDEWRDLLAERGVEVMVDTENERVIPLVRAIPDAVDQIVDNYLDNAVEVAPEGGVVRISLAAKVDRVVISVEDSGPGLTDDEKSRAFDRFWRGDGSRPGSGLGLAIVQALADASGASVRLEDATHSASGVRAIVELAAVEQATPH